MITKPIQFEQFCQNNFARKVLVYLGLILTSIGLVCGQTADERKLELIFQGDIDSFDNGLNFPSVDFNTPFAFSTDGKQIATVWKDKIVLWDVKSGRVLRSFSNERAGSFTSLAISRDGKLLAGGFYDSKNISSRVKLWDLLTGKELDTSKSELRFLAMISGLDFSPDQSLLISTTLGVIKYHVISKRAEVLLGWSSGPAATGGWDYSVNATFSSNGKFFFLRTSEKYHASGGLIQNMRKGSKMENEIIIDPRKTSINNRGEFVLVNNKSEVALKKFVYDKKLDVGYYLTKQTVKKDFSTVFFQPQIDDELIFSVPGKIIKRNLKTKREKEVKLAGNTKAVSEISKNGMFVTNGFQIWNANTGQIIQDLSQITNNTTKLAQVVEDVYLDPEGKLFVGKKGANAMVWDLKNGGKPGLQKFVSLPSQFSFLDVPIQTKELKFTFSEVSDSQFITVEFEGGISRRVALGRQLLLKHFDAEKGLLTIVASMPYEVQITTFKLVKEEILSPAQEKMIIYQLALSKEKSIPLDVGYRGHVPPPITLDELARDKSNLIAGVQEFREIAPIFVRDLESYFNEPVSADGKYRIKLNNNRLVIYDTQRKVEICSLFAVNENDWAVTTPDGRFDASEGALKLMHYSSGLEIISLDQFKEKYYKPGL